MASCLLCPSVLAAICAALVPSPEPRYIPLEPFELALKADLVVDGVITHFDEAQPVDYLERSAEPLFKVRVVEVLVGKADSADLTIREFINWTCASRYAPYEVDQRAVFFLWYQRDEGGSIKAEKPLICMGSGNEGECPVVGEHVLHQGWGLKTPSRGKVEAFRHSFSGFTHQRTEFIEAVRSLRSCFEWKPALKSKWIHPDYPRAFLRQTCTEAELQALMASSDLFYVMVQDSQDYKELKQRGAVEQGK